MHRESEQFAELRSEERGQTMVEYAVVLSVITITILVTIMALGDTSASLVNQVVDVLN